MSADRSAQRTAAPVRRARAALAALVAVTATSLAPRAARAIEREVDPSTYRAALATLGPGDVLRLAPGTYAEGLSLRGIAGTADQPIVITGPASGARAVFGARACCNTISLRDVAYVTLRDLVLDGGGVAVDGIKAEGDARFTHHVTIERVEIRGHGANQQVVGISTKCPSWDWVIRDVRVIGAGTGLYLGNSDGGAPFVRGRLERVSVLDPIGYAIQLKHQRVRPALEGLPTEPSTTHLEGLVLAKTRGASSGADARPNLLIGDAPPSGPGSADRVVVARSLFFQNASGDEALVQAEGDVTIVDSVFVNGFDGNAITLRPQNGRLRAARLGRNTILARGTGVRITSADTPPVVVGNAIFAGAPLVGVRGDGDVLGAVDDARTHLRAPGLGAQGVAGLDLSPLDDALLGAPLALAGLGDAAIDAHDFVGRPRGDVRRGAYEAAAPAPLTLDPPSPIVDAPDAGVPADAAPAVLDATAGAPDAGAARADAPSTRGPAARTSSCRCADADEAGSTRVGIAGSLLAVFTLLRLRRRARA